MKIGLRIIGLLSFLVFLYVFLSDWEFNNSAFSVLLMNVVVIWILLEIYFSVKSDNEKLVFGIFFLILEGFIFYSSLQVGTVMNYNFLNSRTTVYQTNRIQIDRSDGFFGKQNDDMQEYILLKYALGTTLIKEIETAEKENKADVCDVHFPKTGIIFRSCSVTITP